VSSREAEQVVRIIKRNAQDVNSNKLRLKPAIRSLIFDIKMSLTGAGQTHLFLLLSVRAAHYEERDENG
jgi:hypothetical protein